MKLDRTGKLTTLTLTERELYLLRRALERASFIDTPAAEQPDILSFSAQLLDATSRPA